MEKDFRELLSKPEAWSMQLGSFGKIILIIACSLFALSAIIHLAEPFLPVLRRAKNLPFALGVLCVVSAFASLAVLIMKHQYQYSYVFRHSDNSMSPAYLFSALWGGQEGSFLLWALTSSIFSLLAIRATGIYQRWYVVFASLFLACLTGILCFESPFVSQLFENKYMIPNGLGLSPSLLNYWNIIHPPTIFSGFGSLTVLSCWGFSAMLSKDKQSWVSMIRPWALLTSTITGIGLIMGGLWAYETLGWGGFWAWDPVENTSLVPWLWSVALVHGIYVQVAKKKWYLLNAFLASTCMIMFTYGTFITRSGVLKDQSVHSFAEMDSFAVRILIGVLAGFFTLFTVIYAFNVAQSLKASKETAADPMSTRAPFFGLGISTMLGVALAAGFGMSVPVVRTLMQKSAMVVEEGLYNKVVMYFFIPMMIFMTIAPHLSWRPTSWKVIASKLVGALGVSYALLAAVIWSLKWRHNIPIEDKGNVKYLLIFLSWLCAIAITSNLVKIFTAGRASRLSLGGYISHIGLATLVAGLIVSRGYEQKQITASGANLPGIALGYVVNYETHPGEDFEKNENQVYFSFDNGAERFRVRPTLFYPPNILNPDQPKPVTRPYILHRGTYDLYVAIAPMTDEMGEPQAVKVGEKLNFEGAEITYKGMRREGEPGKMGTKFIADLDIDLGAGSQKLEPALIIGESGLERTDAEFGSYYVTIDKLDAATHAVSLQFHSQTPIFPLEVYYKPLANLVWIGAGIMTLGGLIAALYRRNGRRISSATEHEVSPTSQS